MELTLEQRVSYIENHLGIVHDPPEPSEWEEIMRLHTDNVDTYAVPYTGFGNCTDWLPYQRGQDIRLRRIDGVDTTSQYYIRGTNYSKNGITHSTCHELFTGLYYSVFFKNGQMVKRHRYPMGEDRSLYLLNGTWYMFIRPAPHAERKMALQTSENFLDWSDPLPVRINGLAGREQSYNMTPFRVEEEWYAFVTVYDNAVNTVPPYAMNEHTLRPVLYKAVNNSLLEWSPMVTKDCEIITDIDIMQSVATPVVKDGNIYITTIESQRRHTDWCNMNERESKPYFTRVLKMSVANFKEKYL